MMTSFKNVFIRNAKRGTFTREYLEETIANWLMKSWLTEEEAEECLKVLDEEYPLDETETEE